jgi:hypothetical protein
MPTLQERARAEAASAGLRNKVIHAIPTILIPTVIAIVVGVYSDLRTTNGELFWFLVITLLVLQVVFTILSIMSTATIQEAFFEVEDLKAQMRNLTDRLADLQKNVILFSVISELANAWQRMTPPVVANGIKDRVDLKEYLDDLMAPLYLRGGSLFGFQHEELWNFSVYLFDPSAHKLVQVWRDCHRLHPSYGKLGRDWAPGQGHIGKAFADAEPKITGDATDPAVIGLMGAPAALRRDHDATVYRSFASVPIIPSASNATPFGVLVATSDRAGAFDKTNSLVLRLAAGAIANTLEMNQVSYTALI